MTGTKLNNILIESIRNIGRITFLAFPEGKKAGSYKFVEQSSDIVEASSE